MISLVPIRLLFLNDELRYFYYSQATHGFHVTTHAFVRPLMVFIQIDDSLGFILSLSLPPDIGLKHFKEAEVPPIPFILISLHYWWGLLA